MREPRVRGQAPVPVRGKAAVPKGNRKAKANRPVLARPPGGKALARLHYFELARGLKETETRRVRRDRPLVASETPGTAAVGAAGPQADGVSPYLRAFNQKKQMERMQPAVAIPQGWRPLGPFCIPHGQTYGSGPGSRPSIAGRISALAVDPGDASHLLIGPAGGGVWETRDSGKTWEPRTDDQPALATGAIAFDPDNSSIVYAGTGEGDFFRRLGVGLLRSTDGGTTWSLHATAPFSGIGFYDLIVAPGKSNHLLAATSGGLYESPSGGTAWTQRRSALTWDLSQAGKEVFAACADGLYRSQNGGTTWSAVKLPGAPSAYSRMEVCHAPSDSNVVYVFASDGANGYIWRRTISGGAFAAVTPLPPGLGVGQSWYDWFAAVAPNNPDVLYLGAIEVHKGTRSASGTWSWQNLSAKTSGSSIHPDQHCIAFSPTDSNVVYVGNDGGIYRSPNGGTDWESLNKGLAITEFEFLAQHPQFEAWLVGGTQDNGSLRYEGEEVWYHVQDGDGGDCGDNAASPYTCYHTFYGMGMERSTSGGGWGSWSWIGPNPPSNHSSLFYPPLEVNGSVVAQAGTSVFISTNLGTNWNQVPLPSAASLATALAIPSATRVYVGTLSGRIYRIELSGGTWGSPVQLTRPRTGFVSDVHVDPTNGNRLWVCYSELTGSHVFRSDDGGTSWNDVSAGLPDIPANAVAIDPADPNRVWIACDVGVYQTTDAGATWTAFSNLLPNALVKDLVFHEPSRLLRAATQSRGVWEIAVDAGTMPNVELYLRDSVVDTGRTLPSPSGVNDPFTSGAMTYWWQCTDIKVDAPSYQTAAISDVDFEKFEDDHGVFAAGLIHENAQRGRTARVFVQLHNRGLQPATNVAVKIFFANASLGLPNLPAGFWTNFPNNVLPVGSPWQPIAPHKTTAQVASGSGKLIGFEWNVPATAANHTCLLAVVTADNDPIATAELNIGALVTCEKKCGLKNLAIVNPPPMIGPQVHVLELAMWGVPRWKNFVVGMEQGRSPIVWGLVLGKRLAAAAKERKLKRKAIARFDEQVRAELNRLVEMRPQLREQLDLKTAFIPPARGNWFEALDLSAREPEPLVLILDPNPRPGTWSIVQRGDDNTVVGGFTLQVREEMRK